MELAWLEDFIALSWAGQFSRAAESRNISQSGFSRRVKALEDWVGTPLFERDPRGIRLTPAGEQFRLFAEDALRKILLARDQALEASRAGSGSLTFASTHALSLTFFPNWLLEIRTSTVFDTTVRLVADNMVACERLMLHGQAQFLLCHHHPAATTTLKPDQFRSKYLGGDKLVPVSVPAGDTAAPRFPLPGSAADPVPHLSYSEESGMGRILSAFLPAIGQTFWGKPVFTSHVAAVLCAMAKDGLGLAWLPLSLVKQDLEAGRLTLAGDERWHIPAEIRLFRPKSRVSPAAEEFWAAIPERPQGE